MERSSMAPIIGRCLSGDSQAQEELVLLCGPQPSPFLEELPPGRAAWEHLPSRQPTPEQLSFF